MPKVRDAVWAEERLRLCAERIASVRETWLLDVPEAMLVGMLRATKNDCVALLDAIASAAPVRP